MKHLILFILSCGLVFGGVDSQEANCGGEFTAMEGSFDYKVNSHYDPYERCVWLIYPGYATQIQVSITSNETRPAGDGVLITDIDTTESKIRVDNTLANRTGYVSYVFNTPIVIVTFFSDGTNEGYGFRLTYHVVANELSPRKANATIISSAEVYPKTNPTKYPIESGINYDNFALDAFVYTPDFRFTPQQKFAQVRDVAFEPVCDCCDSLYVFEFSVSTNEWMTHGEQDRICGRLKPDYDIYSDDMMMFVFKSDGGSSGTGFKLDYSVLPS